MQGPLRVGIVGGGWAGMAAAVTAVRAGAHVTLFEAAPQLGGRARSMSVQRPDGPSLMLDNGQHILIGAYQTSLALMHSVGVVLHEHLQRLPLGLPMADGGGWCAPRWARDLPAPWGPMVAVLNARDWGWREHGALLRLTAGWWRKPDAVDRGQTVAEHCAGVPERLMQELIEPLCVSALNLASDQASATVFNRVMHDALRGPRFGVWASSDLLLPRHDLGRLWPEAAAAHLAQHHGPAWSLLLHTTVQGLERSHAGWTLHTSEGQHRFDHVIWATHAAVAAKAMAALPSAHTGAHAWAQRAAALQHTAITTVYTHTTDARMHAPMLALRQAPVEGMATAQFVFDRGQLSTDDSLRGVWAWVISASGDDRAALSDAVMAQAQAQWPQARFTHLQTVVDKRAAFACHPGVTKPGAAIEPGLWAAGDYTDGPYPSTLEAAMRSGVAAGQAATGERNPNPN